MYPFLLVLQISDGPCLLSNRVLQFSDGPCILSNPYLLAKSILVPPIPTWLLDADG